MKKTILFFHKVMLQVVFCSMTQMIRGNFSWSFLDPADSLVGSVDRLAAGSAGRLAGWVESFKIILQTNQKMMKMKMRGLGLGMDCQKKVVELLILHFRKIRLMVSHCLEMCFLQRNYQTIHLMSQTMVVMADCLQIIPHYQIILLNLMAVGCLRKDCQVLMIQNHQQDQQVAQALREVNAQFRRFQSFLDN